jgi:hypothetical protein
MRARTKSQLPAEVKNTAVTQYDESEFKRYDKTDMSDMEIPALKLLQGMSPEVLSQTSKLRAGMWYHSILELDLGPEIEEVVVQMVMKEAIVRSPPLGRNMETFVVFRSADGIHWDRPNTRVEVQFDNGKKVEWYSGRDVQSSGLLEFGSSDPSDPKSKPAGQMTYPIIMRILKPAIPGMVIYRPSFMANKSVKRLNTRRDMRPEPPLRQVYTLKAIEQSAPGRLWYVPEFSSNGELRDERIYAELRQQTERLAASTAHIRTADPLDDAIVDNRPGAGNAAY